MRCYTLLLSIFLMTLGLSSNLQAKEIVKVYTYHEKPPYFIHSVDKTDSKQSGIYYDFIDYLNSQQRNLSFELHFLPRVRLESQLNADKLDGIIIGVNPLWFADKNRSKYLWTTAIMNDQDVFLVNSDSNITSSHTEDFIGLTLALARGSYYKGISELIEQGEIQLAATNSAQQNLEMLSYNRADATIMSQLTVNYFLNKTYSKKDFRVLATPHDKFERMILIPKNKAVIYPELSKIVQRAQFDNLWQGQLEKWRIKE